MQQVWIPRTGAPEVLEVRTAPDPIAGPGAVRVRVRAAGINFADIMARMGLYPDAPKLPAVMGYEVSGIVDAVGDNVTSVRVGDRVAAYTRFGGYSDVVVVPAERAARVPDTLSFEKAAAIPVNYLTAWLMLVHLGNVRAGESVLIHAGAGGVGLAALQIARWKGAIVYATASSSKHERLRAAGVTHCIDYRTQDFEEEIRKLTNGRGVDVILDAVGGKSFRKSYRSLSALGRLFLFGVSSFAPGKKRNIVAALRGLVAMPSFRPLALMNDCRGVFGVNVGHLWHKQEEMRAILTEIIALVESGVFDPVVDRAFPFSRAADAHAYMQDRKNFGKVLLVPGENDLA